MNRSKLLLALAGITLVAQFVSVDAHAGRREDRQRCRDRGGRNLGGAALGAAVGAGLGAIVGKGSSEGIAIGAGGGLVTGGLIRESQGVDACRRVEMDRDDRAQHQYPRPPAPYPQPQYPEYPQEQYPQPQYPQYPQPQPQYPAPQYPGDQYPQPYPQDYPDSYARVMSPYDFDRVYMGNYIRQGYNDDARLMIIRRISNDLQYRDSVMTGYSLYQLLLRIDGGYRAEELTKNRYKALKTLRADVARLTRDEASWIHGLFPNRRHGKYEEVRRMIYDMSL